MSSQEFIFIKKENIKELKTNRYSKQTFGFELSRELAPYLYALPPARPREIDGAWLTYLREFYSGFTISLYICGNRVKAEALHRGENADWSSAGTSQVDTLESDAQLQGVEYTLSLESTCAWYCTLQAFLSKKYAKKLEAKVTQLERKIEEYLKSNNYPYKIF